MIIWELRRVSGGVEGELIMMASSLEIITETIDKQCQAIYVAHNNCGWSYGVMLSGTPGYNNIAIIRRRLLHTSVPPTSNITSILPKS